MGTCKLCYKEYDYLERHLKSQHDYMMMSTYKRLTKNSKPVSEIKQEHKQLRDINWGLKISKAKKGQEFILAGWNKGLTKETNFSVAKIANNEVRNEKIRQANIGREITWADKISAIKKEQCKDPEYTRNMMARFANIKTKPEKIMHEILNANFPDEWLYSGDGSFVIAGKTPDFINIYRNTIVEVYGEYWHKQEDEPERIEYFKKFGYNTLVIWSDELNYLEHIPDIIQKIKNLSSVETLHELSRNG